MWNEKNAVWGQTPETKILCDKLGALVPSAGEIENKKDHPALEKYRRAQNVVYDIFNNGLGNRARSCRFALNGLKKADLNLPEQLGSYYHVGCWEQVNHRVEEHFTPIVMEAAIEQGLVG